MRTCTLNHPLLLINLQRLQLQLLTPKIRSGRYNR
jgi:hypothetical protein